MKPRVPDLDIKILNELERDANRSRKLIARSLDISEPTLSKRISQLVDDGIIRSFTIDIDYEAMSFRSAALTLLKLREPTTQDIEVVVEACIQIPECIEVYHTLGEWDICIRWMCEDNASVLRLLGTILNDASIARSETITLAGTAKRVRGVPLKP